MNFRDLYESGKRNRNVGHFASLVTIAASNDTIDEAELALLKRFATRLDITEEEYAEIMKNPSGYPINPPNSADARLGRMLDMFKVIFADNEMDDEERRLIERYAIGLGFTEEMASKLIKRSIEIFQGGLDLQDYRYLLNKE